MEVRGLVDICLEAGATMFDTADVYSHREAHRLVGTPNNLLNQTRNRPYGRPDRTMISMMELTTVSI